MVICLERGADLHMAQLMPLPLTVSCFSKIQIGFTFLVPAHLGSPGKRAVKRVCVCVCCMVYFFATQCSCLVVIADCVAVAAFFSILHSWLNAFAEMLRFADRLFYKVGILSVDVVSFLML